MLRSLEGLKNEHVLESYPFDEDGDDHSSVHASVIFSLPSARVLPMLICSVSIRVGLLRHARRRLKGMPPILATLGGI